MNRNPSHSQGLGKASQERCFGCSHGTLLEASSHILSFGVRDPDGQGILTRVAGSGVFLLLLECLAFLLATLSAVIAVSPQDCGRPGWLECTPL